MVAEDLTRPVPVGTANLIPQECELTFCACAPTLIGVNLSVARRKRARDAKTTFAKPLCLDPKLRHADNNDEFNEAGNSLDLQVWLGSGHCYYNRLLGFQRI